MSEGATGAWLKAEQASGRLHLITNYMSAKDQPDNAHVFMDQMWAAWRSDLALNCLRSFPRVGQRTSKGENLYLCVLKEKSHPCHWSCSPSGPDGREALKYPYVSRLSICWALRAWCCSIILKPSGMWCHVEHAGFSKMLLATLATSRKMWYPL